MSENENRRALERAIEHLNKGFGDPDAAEPYFDLYDENVVLHGFPPGVEGRAGAREFYRGICAAIPDGRVTLEDVIASGDRIAVRYHQTGTHRGELLGVPATGNQIDVTGQTILRFEAGKCVERWQAFPELNLLQQLGAVPVMA